MKEGKRSLRRALKRAGMIGVIASAPVMTPAAETVHAYLKANGVDIQGESTQTSLGRANSIECVGFFTALQRSAGGAVTGGRLTCKKRIDKASPLLINALVQNTPVEGAFKFFRPNPTGDGTTEQFYTIQVGTGSSIVSVEQVNPDTIDAATAAAPPLESFTIQASGLIFTYTNGGVATGWTAQQGG